MSDKPSLPKGTRDFGPAQMARRNYIFDTIRAVFQKFGYAPLETPSMEKLSVLTGKYGDEGDQLLFKVLESGEYFEPAKEKIKEKILVKEVAVIGNALLDSVFYLYDKVLEEAKKRFDAEYSVVIDFKEAEDMINDELRKPETGLFNGVSFIDVAKIGLNHHGEIRNAMEEFFRGRGALIIQGISFFLRVSDTPDKVEDNPELWKNEYRRDEIAPRIVPDFINFLTAFRLENTTSKDILNDISKKGLRYDLTVPFARYVVMNQHEITFPFRRYQIQPVWRADRPQKGRYREFYQCDADVVGTNSLICEAEIVLMLEEVFEKLELTDYTIKVNNRKVLHGLVETLGAQGKETDLLVAIDKLDKIGVEKVTDELRERGFSDKALQQLQPVFSLTGSNEEKLATLSDLLTNSTVGQEGITELREVFSLAQALGSDLAHLELDVTLARGLSYYTGAIFEVKSNQGSLTSSISGGGRYDDLTGVFGLPDVSGVGISFGVDRIYDVLEELNLFPKESSTSTQVLLINFDRQTERQILPLLTRLRQADIAAEIYPEPVKLKKQFAYADKKGIPYVLVIGSKELASQQYSLKDLRSGEQEALSLEAIIQRVKQ